MALAGFIDRITGKSTVSTKLVETVPVADPSQLPDVSRVSPPAAEKSPAQVAADMQLHTVTVAPGRTIGRGNTAKNSGDQLQVTEAEAIRLRATGFIL